MNTGAVGIPAIISVKYRHGEIIDRLVTNGRTAGGEELWTLSRWLLMVFSIARLKPNEPLLVTTGRYLDEYVRTPTGWETSKVKLLLGARDSTLSTSPLK
jgi:hypothetical protein